MADGLGGLGHKGVEALGQAGGLPSIDGIRQATR
jgi:hypothetical protein